MVQLVDWTYRQLQILTKKRTSKLNVEPFSTPVKTMAARKLEQTSIWTNCCFGLPHNGAGHPTKARGWDVIKCF